MQVRKLLGATILGALAALASSAVGARDVNAFGLECWTDGTPYHYNLTWDTLWNGKNEDGSWIALSWSAAKAIAWQNDAFDYYDNNPFMYAQTRDFMETGSPARGSAPWTSGHFDDCHGDADVWNQWNRYLWGAYYGILWAAERNDPFIATGVLGHMFHAIEDFFSHSNWVNNSDFRNFYTPFNYYAGSISGLFTGDYMDDTGWPDHGGDNLLDKFNLLANGALPICTCQNLVGGQFNIDRSCSASLAVSSRGLEGQEDGASLLNKARDRAAQATRAAMSRLRDQMNQTGWVNGVHMPTFFHDVLNNYTGRITPDRPVSPGSTTATGMDNHFHDPGTFLAPGGVARRDYPSGFLTGGYYRYPNSWHFRTHLYSITDGTDGDVALQVAHPAGNRSYTLDREDYDDFEQGDEDAYYHGGDLPDTRPPTQVGLWHQGAGYPCAPDFWNTCYTSFAVSLRVHAYYVGSDSWYATWGKMSHDCRYVGENYTQWCSPWQPVAIENTNFTQIKTQL